ncbi:MAG: RNA polymerase factor sigma-54 [Lachnospiraceae bacterium]|nr:RNA polymerase factor sigma-54 [Lachnospiraceae bacterium]
MNQNLELTQKQILSQHMIQSMEILQMSAVELEEFLENLSMENPVVEISENRQTETDAKALEMARKLEWLSSTDTQNRVYYEDDGSAERAESNWQDIRDAGEDLAGYLMSQLLTADYLDEERQIIDYIIYSLDSKGYFTEDAKEVAQHFGVSEHTVLHLLGEVQELDPAGVGARDLRECLVKQLHRKENYSRITEAIILFYLDEVAKNHLPQIAKKMKISVDEVLDACEEIRSFNPKPGNAFSDRERLRYISPDAVVVLVDDHFEILINEYQYPKFTISSFYQDMAKTVEDAETKKYLKEKIAQAQNIAGSIEQRNSTLSKVLNVLVEKQQDFFLKGPGNKRPMRLIDIAEATDLHESTISRTLRSKYLQCHWGVFPLNYFLTSVAATNKQSGEEQTPEYIKSKMQEVIDNEDKKKPLSDEAISKCLKEMEIPISRRTVNKYRQEMGIPDKSGRKEWGD